MSSPSSKPEQTGRTRSIPKPPLPKKRSLPCGARTCLHCHRGCGVETASYILRGLDDLDNAAEAKAAE